MSVTLCPWLLTVQPWICDDRFTISLVRRDRYDTLAFISSDQKRLKNIQNNYIQLPNNVYISNMYNMFSHWPLTTNLEIPGAKWPSSMRVYRPFLNTPSLVCSSKYAPKPLDVCYLPITHIFVGSRIFKFDPYSKRNRRAIQGCLGVPTSKPPWSLVGHIWS